MKTKKQVGHFSQAKGKRSERALCMDLRRFGYTEVSRIPHWLKGEHQQDVWAKDPSGRLTTFENKARKQMPFWIGKLFRDNGEPQILRFAFLDGSMVALGLNPLIVGHTDSDTYFSTNPDTKILRKFQTLFKWLGGADFLSLRGNRGNKIYAKFWGFK